MTNLRDDQVERYCRNIILNEVGGKGQKKLLESKVLVVGTGGLGSPILYYLAAAGVGHIGVVDSDRVEINNLQRQIIHFTPDIDRPKTLSAKEKIKKLNPDVEVITHQKRLAPANALDIINGYDIVADASDNFPTRYLVNDACIIAGKPLSYGAVFRFDGQVTTILPKIGPCYRCIFGRPPTPGEVPSCQEAGILGSIPGIIGAIQATEILKWLLGAGDLLVGRLLIFDGLSMHFRGVSISRNKECPACGRKPSITNLKKFDYKDFCASK
jgi:adenylyltransferase/sulfurtransferase